MPAKRSAFAITLRCTVHRAGSAELDPCSLVTYPPFPPKSRTLQALSPKISARRPRRHRKHTSRPCGVCEASCDEVIYKWYAGACRSLPYLRGELREDGGLMGPYSLLRASGPSRFRLASGLCRGLAARKEDPTTTRKQRPLLPRQHRCQSRADRFRPVFLAGQPRAPLLAQLRSRRLGPGGFASSGRHPCTARRRHPRGGFAETLSVGAPNTRGSAMLNCDSHVITDVRRRLALGR